MLAKGIKVLIKMFSMAQISCEEEAFIMHWTERRCSPMPGEYFTSYQDSRRQTRQTQMKQN